MKVSGGDLRLETGSRVIETPSPANLRPRTADKKASEFRTGKKDWRAKLAGNKARDRVVNRMLCQNGWRVVRIWEHELRTRMNAEG